MLLERQCHIGATATARGKRGERTDEIAGRRLDRLVLERNRELAREGRMDARRQGMRNGLTKYGVQARAAKPAGQICGFVFNDLHAGTPDWPTDRTCSVCTQPARGINGEVAQNRIGAGSFHGGQ